MSDQEPGAASQSFLGFSSKKKKGKHRSKRDIDWESRDPGWESSKSTVAAGPSLDDPAVSSLLAVDEALEPACLQDMPEEEPSLTSAPEALEPDCLHDMPEEEPPLTSAPEALEPDCLQDMPEEEPPLTSTPPINGLSISETASLDISSVSSSGTSEQFQSNLFKIRVGPKKDLFIAHSDILSKSPKLYAQCHGNFSEAGSKKIRLPDADSKIFALLLEYLYRGDYFPFLKEEFDNIRSDDEDVRATQLRREGDLYCMAEYYQLDELQDLAVRKMKMLTPVTFESFLSVSEYVYSNTGSRGAFHDYFKDQIMEALPLVVHEEWLLDVVAKGGDLARDLFLSGRDLLQGKADDELKDEAAVMVKWEDDV